MCAVSQQRDNARVADMTEVYLSMMAIVAGPCVGFLLAVVAEKIWGVKP